MSLGIQRTKNCSCGYEIGEKCPDCNGLRCRLCKLPKDEPTADASVKPCSCDLYGQMISDLAKHVQR